MQEVLLHHALCRRLHQSNHSVEVVEQDPQTEAELDSGKSTNGRLSTPQPSQQLIVRPNYRGPEKNEPLGLSSHGQACQRKHSIQQYASVTIDYNFCAANLLKVLLVIKLFCFLSCWETLYNNVVQWWSKGEKKKGLGLTTIKMWNKCDYL